MKGIILAGGSGSRLYPLTRLASKQLQPIYDKPMVYYPLSTLIESGIREICLISTPQDLSNFSNLLGNGSHFGVSIEYREQLHPDGIAQAFQIADSFIESSSVALILGDNIFTSSDVFTNTFETFDEGATVFASHVKNPQRYGVVQYDSSGQGISIEEKPAEPKSNYAVPGLYLYDNQVVELARSLKPSARGELEITDLNMRYMNIGQLRVVELPRSVVWFDAGTSSSIHEASSYVQAIEKRKGVKLGCPEEAAFHKGFINLEELATIYKSMPECEYRSYIQDIVDEAWQVTQCKLITSD